MNAAHRFNGDPDGRFWASVYKTQNCWFWIGHIDSGGYGTFYDSGKHGVRAHRESWTRHFGSIPAGKWVLHTCDIRQCVNPEHLVLGTRSENAKDGYWKGTIDPWRARYGISSTIDLSSEVGLTVVDGNGFWE